MQASTSMDMTKEKSKEIRSIKWFFASLLGLLAGIMAAVVLAFFIADEPTKYAIPFSTPYISYEYKFYYPLLIAGAVGSAMRSVARTGKSIFWGIIAFSLTIISIFIFDFLLLTRVQSVCEGASFVDLFRVYLDQPGLYITRWKKFIQKISVPFYRFNATLASLSPFVIIATDFNKKRKKHSSKT